MFDIGTISIILFFAIIALLAIGMPLGLASATLAIAVLCMKFGPDFLYGDFGRGPLNIVAQRIYGISVSYTHLRAHET